MTGSLTRHQIARAETAALMERAVKGRSLWDDARRRLLRNRAAVASMIMLGVLVLCALIGPLAGPLRLRRDQQERRLAARR